MKDRKDFRDYQSQAEDFLLANRRCYLAAKAGAGKTAIGIAAMQELLLNRFEFEKVLVVAPKRVVGQWPREASKWAFGRLLRFSLYLGPRQEREAALRAFSQVLVCSFEFFPELVKSIKASQWPFGMVIFDEASRLRSGGRKGSVSWKAMNAISQKTDCRIVLMSGSPRPGTAHELFAPMFLLDHGKALGKTLGEFRSRYMEPDSLNRATGQVYRWKARAGQEGPLYDAVRHLYFGVSPELGLESIEIDRRVVLPASVEQAISNLMINQVLDIGSLSLTAASQATVTGKVHQMSQGAVLDDSGQMQWLHDEKIEELQEIIEELNEPVIVTYWYVHDLARLKSKIPNGVDITTKEGLEQALSGKVQVAFLHPQSAGHGIDGLQEHFNAIVWMTLPNSYELYDQTNKRIIRSGQKKTVRVYRIIATNGIVDDRIAIRLEQKKAQQDQFFDYLEGGQ